MPRLKQILGRGRGCAATWKANKNGRASEIVSTFIPEYEFPGVSAALEGFDPFFFSMRTLSVAKKKDDIINRLNVLANSYEDWIQKKLIHDSKMDDAKFKKEIGDTVINKCIEALGRIRAGIQLLVEDDTAFDAFCFMNRSITKMILAAELIRQKEYPKYGKEPISIGFWVGGTVTPNTFKELEEAPEDPAKTRIARSKKNSIYKQLLTCPFCGKPLTEENFYIDIPTKSVSIYCSDDKCMFYRYKPSNKIKIPVYLVDEEIYAKCPTIILSTVDKFARLPWDVNTNLSVEVVEGLLNEENTGL